eukprot:2768246-Rhodomonas_salina.2
MIVSSVGIPMYTSTAFMNAQDSGRKVVFKFSGNLIARKTSFLLAVPAVAVMERITNLQVRLTRSQRVPPRLTWSLYPFKY